MSTVSTISFPFTSPKIHPKFSHINQFCFYFLSFPFISPKNSPKIHSTSFAFISFHFLSFHPKLTHPKFIQPVLLSFPFISFQNSSKIHSTSFKFFLLVDGYGRWLREMVMESLCFAFFSIFLLVGDGYGMSLFSSAGSCSW